MLQRRQMRLYTFDNKKQVVQPVHSWRRNTLVSQEARPLYQASRRRFKIFY